GGDLHQAPRRRAPDHSEHDRAAKSGTRPRRGHPGAGRAAVGAARRAGGRARDGRLERSGRASPRSAGAIALNRELTDLSTELKKNNDLASRLSFALRRRLFPSGGMKSRKKA